MKASSSWHHSKHSMQGREKRKEGFNDEKKTCKDMKKKESFNDEKKPCKLTARHNSFPLTHYANSRERKEKQRPKEDPFHENFKALGPHASS